MEKKDEKPMKDVNAITAKPFAKLTAFQKIRHVGKVVVFLLTFGFAFPNIFGE